jgi:two-component sensor histidine kinase
VLPSFYADHGIISTVDVVIKGNGQPYGILEIDNSERHSYDQHDIDFLTGFANVLAEAVGTARRTEVLRTTIQRMKDLIVEKDRVLTEKDRLIDEKNTLAEELQHRVRNNLQLVYGMLNTQIDQSDEGTSKEGLRAIARRVMTLAQVYDHLLGGGMTRTIDFGEYLKSLCGSLKELELVRRPGINLTCHAAPLFLDLDTVTALGIVVAELVSNSYLHAFPGGKGTILVPLDLSLQADEAVLSVGDDGVGFTEKTESKRHGLGLVKRLMHQVRGSVECHQTNPGTRWTMKFPIAANQSAA